MVFCIGGGGSGRRALLDRLTDLTNFSNTVIKMVLKEKVWKLRPVRHAVKRDGRSEQLTGLYGQNII